MTDGRKPRLLFYFLHLLGVGHVYRAKRLIEGFANAGIEVDIIYGGEPIGETFDAASIHYLPPIRAADAAYQTYLDDNGNVLGEAYLKMRETSLLAHFATLQPDVVLLEAFPFGRRMVRHEISVLLKAASERQTPPLIVSSVRDILQERKKPGRIEESRDWIRDWFDHVLVHSDPDVIGLDATFPLAAEIANKLSYSGFVVPDLHETKEVEPFDVIATVGGGAFGAPLLQAALGAAQSPSLSGFNWCLATGPHMPPEAVEELKAAAPSNVTIATRLDNLAAHLVQAKFSISQCGYNTAMDVLRVHHESACRAVFVPYDTEGQSEQLRRAELLAEKGYAVNLPQSRLTPQRLVEAIEKARNLPLVDHEIDFDGVSNSARLVRTWIEKRTKP